MLAPEGELACQKGHALRAKTVAGSWLGRAKACTLCNATLSAGAQRHSCKPCGFHLCDSCHSSRLVAWMNEEITVTVYRPAVMGSLLSPGLAEDTLSVRIERGAQIGRLRALIEQLYGVPCARQAIRRDQDGPALGDDEPLRCGDGDVLILELTAMVPNAPPGAPFGGAMAQAVAAAMSDVMNIGQTVQQSLERSSLRINFVLPGRDAPGAAASDKEDRRCMLEVSLTAKLKEVLEMVKLELVAESDATGLEFAGNALPLQAPLLAVGLQDGDTVIVLRNSKQ